MEISVIIPAYNVEKYLENTLKSILNQSFEDFEVILVDDGSVDKTPKIMAAYAAQDKRIKVINKKNEGVGAARNAGMQVAAGKYLYFADADDILHPQILEFLYQACEKEQADFACCDFKVSKWGTDLQIVQYKAPENVEVIDNPLEYACINHRKVSHNVWNKLYKKEALGTLAFLNYKCAEDLYFNICAMRNFSKGVFVPLPLYFYVLSPGSLTRKKWDTDYLDIHMVLYKKLKEDFDAAPRDWQWVKTKIVNCNYYYLVNTILAEKDKIVKHNLKKYWAPKLRNALMSGIIGMEGLSLRKRLKLFSFMLF